MRAVHWRQSLAVVVLSMTLLMFGAVGLGVVIRYGAVLPPDLDVSLGGLHIVASITDPRECRLAPLCPGPRQDSYVVWVFYKTAPDDVGKNEGRILVVKLKH